MAFEYRSEAGLIRMFKVRRHWRAAVATEVTGSWASPGQALAAITAQLSGLATLDEAEGLFVPTQLIDWTPTGEDL